MNNREYVKVIVAAGSVIKKNEKYLLVQEKKPEAYGLWNFPAGRVEVGDTIEKTAIKEVKEESGYDVELIKKIGIFHKNNDKAVKHIFEAKILGGELNYPKNEFLDAKWFTWKEIKNMKDKLRADCIIEAISILEKE